MLIEDLNLSVRSEFCLKRAGIETVEDLMTKTEHDLREIRNLGKKSLAEIIKKLDSMNLSLLSEAGGDTSGQATESQ